jgi:hypothetical protein
MLLDLDRGQIILSREGIAVAEIMPVHALLG